MDMPDLDELTDMPYLIPTMLFPSNIHQSGKSMRLFFTFTFIVMIMMVMMMISGVGQGTSGTSADVPNVGL